jgi:hypothetical protein
LLHIATSIYNITVNVVITISPLTMCGRLPP